MPLWFAAICYRRVEPYVSHGISREITDSFQVALNVSYVSAARTTWVLSRLLDHVLVEAPGVEDASVYDLEALDVGTLLKDSDGGRRH